MKKIIDLLSKFTGLTEAVLQNAFEKDDITGISLEGMKIYKDADIETIKANFQGIGTTAGKKEAISQLLKDSKEKAGLEIEPTDFEGLLKEYQKKVLKDAKIEPDKKMAELQNQLQTVQTTLSQRDMALSQIQKDILNERRKSLIFEKLPSVIPGNLSKNEAAMILEMGIDTVFENGKYFPVENGAKKLDEKGNPIDFAVFIETKIKDKGWIEQSNQPGKGGNHQSGAGSSSIASISDIKSMADYEKYIETNKIQGAAQCASVLTEAMMRNGKEWK